MPPSIAAGAPAERVEQGNLILDGVPAPDPALGAKLRHYLQGREARFIGWLADGSLLISTRFGETEQLHRVRAPLGQREQLTYSGDPVEFAAANPQVADSLVFAQDHGGDENPQLYQYSISDGSARLLTDGKSRQGPPAWANDGKRIAYFSNARDGASYDIYVSDTTSPAPPRLVVGGDKQPFYVLDWSVDDQRLLLLKVVSSTESYLYVAELASGRLSRLEPEPKSKASMTVSAARFSRDGRGVYFVSTHDGEFAELRYTDMFTLATRSLAPQSRWDVQLLELSRDGRYLAYTLNEGGISRLVVHDIRQQADLLLPPLPPGAVIESIGFDGTGSRLAVGAESARSPRDVFVYELADKPSLTRWTQSELGPLNPSQLVPAEPMHFASWDQIDGEPRMIPAYIYRATTPGLASGADLHPRRAGIAVPAWLGRFRAVSGQ